MDEKERIVLSQSQKLAKLEARMHLLNLLDKLDIEPAKDKASVAWHMYMHMLGDLMSKAY